MMMVLGLVAGAKLHRGQVQFSARDNRARLGGSCGEALTGPTTAIQSTTTTRVKDQPLFLPLFRSGGAVRLHLNGLVLWLRGDRGKPSNGQRAEERCFMGFTGLSLNI